MEVALLQGGDQKDPAMRGPETFLRKAHDVADWCDGPNPFELDWDQIDDERARASVFEEFYGTHWQTGAEVKLTLRLVRSGTYFVGAMVVDRDLHGDDGFAATQRLFMEVAAGFFADFAYR